MTAKNSEPTILEKIAASTKERVANEKAAFTYPFEKALAKKGLSFICEVKKASPSKGVIAEDFPYLQIVREYKEAGAAAISVLTEPEYFLGSTKHLQEIAELIDLPVLRKDFFVDPYMIYEAKFLGASAVLLICSLLDDKTLTEYIGMAHNVGMSALVETHTEEEVRRALAAGARVIGVNNRNLRTFEVDISTSERLREKVPPEILFVAESGIKTADDVARLEKIGVDAVLIGEHVMRAADKKTVLSELKKLLA